MSKLSRKIIHNIARNSNWSDKGVDEALQHHVFSDKDKWARFTQFFLLSIGAGFLISGIIFFFAYNWEEMTKFFKLGLVEILLLGITIGLVYSGWSDKVKNILLTFASFLVGVVFAVYGQIYQTGANEYDFFMGWTAFITLWALISNFAPLWTVWLTLLYTTFFFYSEKIGDGWSGLFLLTIIFCINTAFLLLSHILSEKSAVHIPKWFQQLLGLASATCATLGFILMIFDGSEKSSIVFIPAVLFTTGLGIVSALRQKELFYLAITGLCIIIVGAALLLSHMEGINMLLLVSLFVLGSTAVIITLLMNLQKKWNHAA